MRVVSAVPTDLPTWLNLAREVEPLFGPLVANPDFCAPLKRAIEAGNAFCVRTDDGPPGAPLLGGLLWFPDPPRYKLGWLAVAEQARRRGIARLLVDDALARVVRPATIRLTTFADGAPEGEAARRLYERVGFRPAGSAPDNPAGFRCEVLSMTITQQSTARAVIAADGRYLLAQHYYAIPANMGKWSLIGGRIEDGERDPEAALRRELSEELSAPPLDIRPLHVYPQDERLHHIFTARLDLSGGPLRADPTEVAAFDWFTCAEVEALHRAGKLLGRFVYDAVRDAERSRA